MEISPQNAVLVHLQKFFLFKRLPSFDASVGASKYLSDQLKLGSFGDDKADDLSASTVSIATKKYIKFQFLSCLQNVLVIQSDHA